MAHFACIDKNGIIQNVIFIENIDILDETGKESEEIGISICNKLFPEEDYKFKQTSYNSNFRNTYAKIGMIYNEELDSFIDVRPHNSWTLDVQTKKWIPPIPTPELNEEMSKTHTYIWNEESLNWILVSNNDLTL